MKFQPPFRVKYLNGPRLTWISDKAGTVVAHGLADDAAEEIVRLLNAGAQALTRHAAVKKGLTADQVASGRAELLRLASKVKIPEAYIRGDHMIPPCGYASLKKERCRKCLRIHTPPEVELHSDWRELKKPGHYGSGKQWRCTIGCHKRTRLARFARPQQGGRDNGACLQCARRGLPIDEAPKPPKPTTRKR